MSKATEDVLAERQRQIEAEGWTDEHDDAYEVGELAAAGASYAGSAWLWLRCGAPDPAPAIWPWAAKWWKPKNPRRDLVRAAALLIAEIERIDRAALKATVGGKAIMHVLSAPKPPVQLVKRLTDEQISEIEGWFSNEFGLEAKHSTDFARTIETACAKAWGVKLED